MYVSKKIWIFGWLLVFLLAAGLRLYKLSSVPAGLHQDELWFGYNAFLLLETGKSIYGERLPLSLDMWGEQVPAMHSYALLPWVALFGPTTFAFRFGIVVFSLLSLLLSGWIVVKLTGSRAAGLLTGLFYATSTWNIIMSRASSTVVLDGFVVLLLIAILLAGIDFFESKVKRRQKISLFMTVVWSLLIYAVSGFAYITYFTSRMMVPAVLCLFVGFARLFAAKQARKILTLAILIPCIVYLIFPFALLLKTPFALGRYNETKLLESDAIKVESFLNITRSGMAGVPVFLTRMLFNKVVLDARALVNQYTAFISPSVLLSQTFPPMRYFVPNTGVLSWYEYLGFLLALGAFCFGLFISIGSEKSEDKVRWWRSAAFVLLCLAVSLLPTALTRDDFPNLQRGVFSTPYWQMTAAIGFVWWLRLFHSAVRNGFWKRMIYIATALIFGSFLVFHVVHFMVSYIAIGPQVEPYYRSRPGEKLGKWINDTIPNAKLVMDTDEANFLYPYLYKRQKLSDFSVSSSNPRLLLATELHIGNRTFYKHLCEGNNVEARWSDADYVVVKLYPDYPGACEMGMEFQLIHQIPFDDGKPAYDIYKRMFWPVKSVKR